MTKTKIFSSNEHFLLLPLQNMWSETAKPWSRIWYLIAEIGHPKSKI